MRTRSLLMHSASIVAVAAGASSAAQAQDPVTLPLGYTVSFEGGFLMGHLDNIDKMGEFDRKPIKELQGYNAAVSVSRRLDPQWDLQVNANAAFFSRKAVSIPFTSGAFGGIAKGATAGNEYKSSAMNFQTLDFEIGYRPLLGQTFDLRLFAGLRALHAVKTSDKTGFVASGGSFYATEGSKNTTFTGIGPRIGVNATKRFEGTMFGISGMIAGAAIFGPEETNISIETLLNSGGGSSGGYFHGTNYGSKTVYNLEGSLGIDLYLSDTTLMTLGYRAQQFWNIGNSLNVGPSSGGTSSKDLIHGPFMKVTTTF